MNEIVSNKPLKALAKQVVMLVVAAVILNKEFSQLELMDKQYKIIKYKSNGRSRQLNV